MDREKNLMSKDRRDNSGKSDIHRDFHGILSYCLQHVYEKYGEQEMVECLRQIARNVYGPLTEAIRKEGLSALEEHWRNIFTVEEADFELYYEDGILALNVKECPSIGHMKSHGHKIFRRHCEHTRIIDEEICRLAGYACSVAYNQEKGFCLQKFWKEKQANEPLGVAM